MMKKKTNLGSSSVEIDHLDCYSIDVCCNSGSVKVNTYLDFVDTPPPIYTVSHALQRKFPSKHGKWDAM